MTYQIDLTTLDRAGFKLTQQGDEVLVQPHRTKHAWREDELHLRSLVTDTQGRVRSAGWPKFFNHGENAEHDAQFQEALAAGEVEFAEKLDGMLIVADAHAGAVRLRTRGQTTLGEFEGPVRGLIEQRHAGLLDLLRDQRDPVVAGHSLLFEYVAPDHTIVVRYDEPALYFLGAVERSTLAPRYSRQLIERVVSRTGIAAAPTHALPTHLDGVLAHVNAMSGKEGVVARFRGRDGRPLLLKLKAAEYLRIYGRRATLGERGAVRLALLLDLRSEADVASAFARVGLDHEAAAYALGSLRPFFAARDAADAALARLQAALAPDRARLSRRDYVERVETVRSADPALAGPHWFTAAIKLLEGRDDHARLIVLSALTGEPVPTLRVWLKDRKAALDAMMSVTPSIDDDA